MTILGRVRGCCASPRVSMPVLWILLERHEISEKYLETIMHLHETTEYKVKGRKGMSGVWMPGKGLREGCSTTLISFKIYHQAVRQASEAISMLRISMDGRL